MKLNFAYGTKSIVIVILVVNLTGCFFKASIEGAKLSSDTFLNSPITDTTPINKTISIELQNPPVDGTTTLVHNITVNSETSAYYIYKYGDESAIDCTDLSGYSTTQNINQPLPVTISRLTGNFALCVLGINSQGQRQSETTAVKHIWRQSWKPFIYIENPGQQLVPTTNNNLNIHAPAEWTEIYVTQDPSCASGGAWQARTSQVPVNLAPDAGTKIAVIYTQFKNAKGELSECVSDSIKVSSPATISSCSGATSSDALSGEFIDSGGLVSDYQDNESCTLTLTGGPKVFTFEIFDIEDGYDYITIYKDAAGIPANILIDATGNTIPPNVNSSSNTNLIQFISDSSVTAPGYKISWTSPSVSGTNSLKISSGAESTSTRNVTLDIQAVGQFTEMYITNDNSCSIAGSWEALSSTKAWTLSAGNGTQSVYIKFRDPAGVESACESDSILLYDGPPAMATLSGVPANNSGDDNLNITVGGTDIAAYKFKLGPTSSTVCTDPSGYSIAQSTSNHISSSLISYGSQSLTVCVLGINPIGVSQNVASPTVHTWFRDVPLLIQFESSGETIAEGASSVSFKLVANGIAISPITISYDVYGDFVSSQGYTSGQVTIPTGGNQITITLPITASPVASTDKRIAVGITDLTVPHRQGLIAVSSKLVIDAERAALGVLDIGYNTNCAILSDGKLVCRDSVGGNRESTNRFVEGFQQHVSSKTFKSIVTDQQHKCALSTDNLLYCWGWGFDGQLGLGDGNDQIYPQLVPSLTWKKVVSSHTWNNVCGIDSNDDLYCWGDQDYSYGAAGNGTSVDSKSPTLIDVANKYKEVYIKGSSACAITLTTNQLKCWGANSGYNLGDGTNTNRYAPVSIDAGVEYTSITFSSNYTQGITTNGDWKYWGFKIYDSSFGQNTTPITIDASRDYTVLAGHGSLACGLSGGYLYCIGNDFYNSMGFGNYISTPTLIDSTDRYLDIKAIQTVICGITIANKLKCFGSSLSSSESSKAMVGIPNLPAVWDSDTFSKIIEINNGLCAITQAGIPKCFFKNASANIINEYRETWIPRLIDSTFNIRTTSAKYIIDESNKAYIWGDNVEGDYTFTRRLNPSRTLTNYSISKISEGNGTLTCFIDINSKLFCWGTNPGNGTATSTTPVAVDAANNYTQVSVAISNNAFACGITNTNVLKCWGANALGQLGLSDTTNRLSPEVVGTDFTKLSIGASHVCALKTTGELYCWGSHTVSLGNSTTQSLIPVRINSSDLFTDIVTGPTNCAIRSDNSRVMCWGSGPSIGDGSASNRLVPTLTTDASTYQKIFVDSKNGAALCGITGTSLKCWGNYKWPRTYSPTLVNYAGTIKSLYLGEANYLIDNSGKLYYFNFGKYVPFGQQAHPKFEPLMGLIDRTPPVAP